MMAGLRQQGESKCLSNCILSLNLFFNLTPLYSITRRLTLSGQL